MDVNKGRFAEIFPVVTTVYKSTSPMGFMAALNNSRKTVIWYNINLGIIHRRKPVILFGASLPSSVNL